MDTPLTLDIALVVVVSAIALIHDNVYYIGLYIIYAGVKYYTIKGL